MRRSRVQVTFPAPFLFLGSANAACGCSSVVKHQLPKLRLRVRFPSPAPNHFGALAQLGARHTGSVEVRGSNPLCSTNPILHKTLLLCRWLCRHGLVVISKRKNQRIFMFSGSFVYIVILLLCLQTFQEHPTQHSTPFHQDYIYYF